jgi:dienelactone hydrolase
MRLKDYLLLAATETGGPATAEANRKVIASFQNYLAQAKVSAAAADALLAAPMQAKRDAPPLAGSFPLVLIAGGNGEGAYDQAFLAEMLAFRGYVVATTPSPSRITGPMGSQSDIPAYAAAGADDIAFTASDLKSQPVVRAGSIGLIGYSFGARSALLYEMRARDVSAFVSLDGGIGSRTGKGELEKAPGFDPKSAAAPLLHLYEDGDRFMPVDLDLIGSLDRCDRWLVRVEGMRHSHFSTMGVLAGRSPELASITQATPRTASARRAVTEATAAFLERFLSHPRTAESPAAWVPPPSGDYSVRQLPRR